MHVRELSCIALFLGGTVSPPPVWSQATKDQARLVFTVSAGAVVGQSLWMVGPQAVQFTTPTDSFELGRRIRSSIAIGFGGAYFPGEHLGVGVEGFLIGLGFEDSCRQVFSSGNMDVATVCQSIQGATKSASSVVLSAGPIVRFNSRKLISPYARANLGIVFSNQSPIRTAGEFPTPSGFSELVVYEDDHQSRVEPALALGAGFTAAVGKGYQLRWEIRDNIVGVQRVTGTTPEARTVPPHERAFKHVFSMTIGFDVVLERRRGRRY